VVSHHQLAKDTAEAGLIRLVRVLAVILPLLALAQVAANSRDYSRPAVAMVVWLAVLGAGAWLVPRLRTGGLATAEVAAAIAIAVAAVAATGAVHRAHDVSGGVDLAILGTVWLLMLVAMSRSARVWIPAGLLVYAVQSALFIRDGGLDPLSLSELAAAGYIIAAVLTAFAASRPALAIRVSMAARQASLASRLAAERAAASAIQQERRGRLAVLEKEALPLLRAIAEGTLDPADEGVRQECARHAAALRGSLTGGAGTGGQAGGLVAWLGPALRAAAARGLPVTVQLIGDPGTPGLPVARALLATVDAVLSALPPHHVTLTVIAHGDEVELYLTFGAALPAEPDLTGFWLDVPAAARWRARVTATESGGGCLEVSWRKDSAG
jgi:fructose-specific component phosphotransferase system IIB-like protein